MADMEQQVRTALEAFWDERAIMDGPDGESIVDELVAPVESFTAVDVLTQLDGIVGQKIPSSAIQAGGYMSRDEFIEKLTAQAMKYAGEKK
jgi:hypothetical protein